MHDPRSSAADWSVFGEDWSGGVAIVPNVWCHWLDWVIVLCFLFFFFFNGSTVISTCAQYLYQKTGLMSCSPPVLGGMKFCLFFFSVCSHGTGLRTLRYTKNIC